MTNPKIRFKRDDGTNFPNWEDVNISSLGLFLRGQTYNRNQITSDKKAVFIIRSSNLKDNWFVDVKNEQQLVDIDLSANEYLKKGDVVICTANGSTSLVGKSSIYNGDYAGPISWGAFCSVFRSNEDAPLAKYFFRTSRYRNLINCMKQGGNGSLGNLNVKEISKMNIPFPCLEEQQKIASFFSTLDEKISLAERKLEATEKLKKGLLQKIFSQELRFKSDTGKSYPDWNFSKIQDIGKVGDIDHKMPKSVTEGIPYLMTGDIFAKEGIDWNTVKKIAHSDYESLCKKFKPEKNDIVIARYASVGSVKYIDFDLDFLVSYSCATLKINKENCAKYIYYYLSSKAVQSQIKKMINTGTQANIGIKDINRISIAIPHIDEQMKISLFFSAIDEKIKIARSEKLALMRLKQGLMQQMFV